MPISPEILQILLVGMSLVMTGVSMIALYHGTKATNDWKRRIHSVNRSPVADRLSVAQPSPQRLWWQQRLEDMGSVVKPRQQQELSLARSRLLKAGYRRPVAVSIYYLVKYSLFLLVLGTVSLLLWGGLRYISTSLSAVELFIYTIAMAAIGYFAPDFWLRFKIKQREEKIRRAFPDALDLLVLCIESGLGIDASMQRSADDLRLTHPLLSQELQLVTDGIRAGQSRQAAFEAFNQRVDIDDIHNFTSLITQTERLGVSVTESMRTISESMRTKRRNEAERIAAQLPVKLFIPVVIFIFPGLFIIILLPAALQLYHSFSSVNN